MHIKTHIIDQQISTQLTPSRYNFIMIAEGTSLLEKLGANRDQEYLHVDKLIVSGYLRCVKSEYYAIKIWWRVDRLVVLCELMHIKTHIIGQQISTQLTPSRYNFILITEGTNHLEKAIANRDQEYLHVDKLIVLCDLRRLKSRLRTINHFGLGKKERHLCVSLGY